eukprot:scaffold47750_cov54-Attheya_sp.AAC.3
MKIFGKRTKKVPLEEEQKSPTKPIVEETNENVTSYFSPNFRPASSMEEKKAKKETDAANEIKVLLAKDQTTLNAKERRLIRRHKERTTEPNSEPQEKSAEEKVNEADKEVNSEDASMTNKDSTAPVSNESNETNEKESIASISKPNTADDSSLPLLDRLQGLNSKQRRNLLRKIKKEQEEQGDEVDVDAAVGESSENVLVLAELEARKVAERNRALEREELDKTLNKKRKSKALTEAQIKKKKKLASDLSHLPPEERARRENQRKMQKEAVERRARGEVSETRHPLNSERRRANRRKPPGVRGGKKDKVGALVKKDDKANYAAGGYNIRKAKVSNP